jgi:hypothetical protein
MKATLILAAVLLVAACGCDSEPDRRYTVTTPDGRAFKQMRWKMGGRNWNAWSDPSGRQVLIEGPHVAVEEIEAEAKSE